MRYAIISDIHGNLHALEAVLRDLEEQKVEKRICLGDVVGYGAFPNECVKLVRDLGFTTVAGNHDFAVLEKLSTEHFNRVARAATDWTRAVLDKAAEEFLRSLGLVYETGPVTAVHASLSSPALFDYVQCSYDAAMSLAKLKGRVCFIGHSHIPVSFIMNPCVLYSMEPEISVPKSGKVLVNVGSVGQPRDQNPRASYAIYDDQAEKISIRRLPYDIEGAIEAIREKGLPPVLGDRLRLGR